MTDLPLRADVRGFYAALGINIPAWATSNANVRCFIGPEQHQQGDAHPSMSVSLLKDAWKCHGCGATGRAVDAALANGHNSRSATELMIAHGLTEPGSRIWTARELVQFVRRPSRFIQRPKCTQLRATEADLQRWRRSLLQRPSAATALARERRWTFETMRNLELGWDRERLTIPIRDQEGTLTGVLRYQPYDTGRPKMLAVPGTRLGLIPHPRQEQSERIVLVEGPPDMIAARSAGIHAIAVPGDHAWQPAWAQTLAGRHVVIIMDADAPGRAAAERIHQSLRKYATVEVLDLAPERDDGYDLTDWLTIRSARARQHRRREQAIR